MEKFISEYIQLSNGQNVSMILNDLFGSGNSVTSYCTLKPLVHYDFGEVLVV